MVIFDLICLNGHRFEGWFQNLSEVEGQIKENIIACPICGESTVTKCPSTFGLVKKNSKYPAEDSKVTQKKSFRQRPLVPKELLQLQNLLLSFTEKIQSEFADVGTDFTQEALKMHYGVTPKKSIRGISTNDEEEILKKEGVEFIKVPMLIRKGSVT
jgi:hypothetical protein